MRKFDKIFDKVMIEITPTEVAMLKDVPVVTMNGSTWVEFTTWANMTFSPHLHVRGCWLSGCGTCVHTIIENFDEKSHSVLKANGIDKYSIDADGDYTEDGRIISYYLELNIPVIPTDNMSNC